MGDVLLELRGIDKAFAGVRALIGVDFTVRAGEVHAVIGENGAGKSTLVKVMTGVHQPDAGTIQLDGHLRDFRSPTESQRAGISAIHQEVPDFPALSVTDNIFMGHHDVSYGFVRWKRMKQYVVTTLHDLGIAISPNTRLKELSIAERHLVEIVKALSTRSRIVIMDEPTSALSYQETRELFRIVRKLKAEGKAIVFISHKFDEISEIADSYTVLRDGHNVGEGSVRSTDIGSIIRLMVGRDIADLYPERRNSPGRTILEVKGFNSIGVFHDVTFSVREGEILGIYGLVGAGRTEVLRAVLGLDPHDSGELIVDGHHTNIGSVKDAMKHEIAFVPENRQEEGVAVEMSIRENTTLAQLDALATGPFTNRARETRLTDRYCRQVAVKAEGWEQPVKALSGGNQQKVVIAKWLALDPRILFLDEPTKGIDIGTKAAVHRLIADLAEKGCAIVMVSSEIPEVQGMSDRLIVMRAGRVTGVFDRGEADSERILAAAIGHQGTTGGGDA